MRLEQGLKNVIETNIRSAKSPIELYNLYSQQYPSRRNFREAVDILGYIQSAVAIEDPVLRQESLDYDIQ